MPKETILGGNTYKKIIDFMSQQIEISTNGLNKISGFLRETDLEDRPRVETTPSVAIGF